MIAELQNLITKLNNVEIKYHAVYLYGSQVYQTANENSDWDFLVITESENTLDQELAFEKKEMFLSKLKDHDIRTLECLFLDTKYKCETETFKKEIDQFQIKTEELRSGISAKASHSWVKAKKKLEVELDEHRGLKSLFHALRILKFGLQIARTGKINDFTEANHYWTDINAMADHSWPSYKEKYQVEYNRLKTEFRKET